MPPFEGRKNWRASAEALAGLAASADILVAALADRDPYLRHAAVLRLSRPDLFGKVRLDLHSDPKIRAGALLAWRASGLKSPPIADFLKDTDPDVRLLALKWIADERLVRYRPHLREALENPGLDHRGYVALATALGRLDDQPVTDEALAGYFLARL